MDLNAILRIAVELGASDIHMKLDQPPMLRTDGSIAPLPGCPELGAQDLLAALETVTQTAPDRMRQFHESGDLDIAYTAEGLPRFRVNVFRQRGSFAIVMRVIPSKVPTLGDLQLGGRWVEIDERLGRRDDETVIVKKGASGFFGTNLASVLVSQGVDTVILCGATTSGCVRATAIDLLQYGWPTLVPRECVGDRAQAPHDANLFDIQAKYADVVSVEDAVAYVESVAQSAGATV